MKIFYKGPLLDSLIYMVFVLAVKLCGPSQFLLISEY